MYLVAIGWLYVVMMMALAEALGPQGSVLGAVITLVLYGLLPLAIVLYIMGTPARRRARRAAEAAEAAAAGAISPPGSNEGGDAAPPSAAPSATPSDAPSAAPDGSRHAAGAAIAAVRKEV